MSERSWEFIPGTKLGKWSVGLVAITPILFVIGSSFSRTLYEGIQAGRTILADISARPLVSLTMLGGMTAGVSGFITGLLAIIQKKENALLVYLSTILGGLLILFLIAEIAFPH